jgi:uncharacterized protein YbjT (DUF2867 family)
MSQVEGRRILVIGAHGMLGRPVTREFVKEGFQVRALARDPERARPLLPDAVDIVRGDLRSIDELRRAADGVDAIYINLSTMRASSTFQAERDGVRNLVEALRGLPPTPCLKISALGMTQDTNGWPEAEQKREADKRLLDGEHPAVIFQPSWMMESIPLMIQGRFLMRMGGARHPIRWLAGEDLGRWAVEAIRHPETWNRAWPAEGPEALSVDEACRRFVRAWDPRIRIVPNPLWMSRVAGVFLPMFRNLVKIVEVTNAQGGEFLSGETWEALGRPTTTIEDYAESIRRTGDYPRKSLV